jgi:hypothetical protein
VARRLVPESVVADAQAQIADAVKAALAQQRISVMANLHAHGIVAAATVDKASLWHPATWRAAVDKHVAPVAAAVALTIVNAARQAVPAHMTWGAAVSAPAMAARITDSVDRAGGRIATAIATASAAADEVEQHVSDLLDSAIGWVADIAGRIAGSAAAEATVSLADHINNLGYGPITQVWNSAFAQTSREDHMDADGQEVSAGEPFLIGDEELMYPGDPSGSDENTINCLCWLTVNGVGDDVPAAQDIGDEEQVVEE